MLGLDPVQASPALLIVAEVPLAPALVTIWLLYEIHRSVARKDGASWALVATLALAGLGIGVQIGLPPADPLLPTAGAWVIELVGTAAWAVGVGGLGGAWVWSVVRSGVHPSHPSRGLLAVCAVTAATLVLDFGVRVALHRALGTLTAPALGLWIGAGTGFVAGTFGPLALAAAIRPAAVFEWISRPALPIGVLALAYATHGALVAGSAVLPDALRLGGMGLWSGMERPPWEWRLHVGPWLLHGLVATTRALVTLACALALAHPVPPEPERAATP